MKPRSWCPMSRQLCVGPECVCCRIDGGEAVCKLFDVDVKPISLELELEDAERCAETGRSRV